MLLCQQRAAQREFTEISYVNVMIRRRIPSRPNASTSSDPDSRNGSWYLLASPRWGKLRCSSLSVASRSTQRYTRSCSIKCCLSVMTLPVGTSFSSRTGLGPIPLPRRWSTSNSTATSTTSLPTSGLPIHLTWTPWTTAYGMNWRQRCTAATRLRRSLTWNPTWSPPGTACHRSTSTTRPTHSEDAVNLLSTQREEISNILDNYNKYLCQPNDRRTR